MRPPAGLEPSGTSVRRGDDDFPVNRVLLGPMVDPVCPFDRADGAICKKAPDFHRVVQGEEPFALQPEKNIPKLTDRLHAPRLVVAGPATDVRRIEEEERFLPIIEGEELPPVQILDVDFVEPGTQFRQTRNPGQKGTRAAGRRYPEAVEAAPEGFLVDEEPPGRPLDVRQTGLLAIGVEILPAMKRKLQLRRQGFRMKPGYPVEIDEIGVDVVDRLNGRSRLGKEYGEPPSERFRVTAVFRNERQNEFQQATFAARPTDARFEVFDRLF